MTNEEYEQAVCDEGQRSRLTFDIEVRAMIKEAVEMEREACARLCDENINPNADKYEPVSQYQSGCYITAEYLATAIRARQEL